MAFCRLSKGRIRFTTAWATATSIFRLFWLAVRRMGTRTLAVTSFDSIRISKGGSIPDSFGAIADKRRWYPFEIRTPVPITTTHIRGLHSEISGDVPAFPPYASKEESVLLSTKYPLEAVSPTVRFVSWDIRRWKSLPNFVFYKNYGRHAFAKVNPSSNGIVFAKATATVRWQFLPAGTNNGL